MRQAKIQLTEEERATLKSFRSKGQHMTREVNRAHILSALDQNVPEKHILSVLGVGRTAIWRTRSAYLEKGLDYALHDGARRWTIALLTEAIRQQLKLRKISRESIRLFLKKTTVSRGGN
ncbi:MAG: helix-turn-helix domain-containing protein [Candidatus Brocadia sp.]|nr:MAG: helix-turn-helix domain-containing protein [Candidatus Brocadia sp.]